MTAIFSSNDLGAIELLDVADRLGVEVPDDLSVVGFDECSHGWTGAYQSDDDRAATGAVARQLSVDTLAARVEGDLAGGPVTRTVELELVVRGIDRLCLAWYTGKAG